MFKNLLEQMSDFPHFFSSPIAATTVHFSSGERLRIYGIGSVKSEADDLTLRFRTIHAHALLFATRDDGSADRMELALGNVFFACKFACKFACSKCIH